jgi:alpha-L-arabinofuranosidase
LDKAQRAAVRLDGVSSVAPEGTETVLSSASQEDENSLDQPKRVAPVSRHVAGLSRQFDYTFAANSVTFLRIRATK